MAVPELCIVEEDGDLDKAYEKLESEKEQYFSEMVEGGFEEYIKKPEKTQLRNKFRHNLALFGIKLIIILIICFVGVKVAENKDLSRSLLSIVTIVSSGRLNLSISCGFVNWFPIVSLGNTPNPPGLDMLPFELEGNE